MTIYKEVNRQRQSSWQSGQAGQPEAAVSLPEGTHSLSMRSSGLWGFEAEGKAYTIKKRQTESTKPNLYIMAELKPRPAYVSSLYFRSYCTGEQAQPSDDFIRLSGWHYVAQAPAADSPLLYVSLWAYKAERQLYAPSQWPEWHEITINREFYCFDYTADTLSGIDGQAFMA